jgi:glycerol kinase
LEGIAMQVVDVLEAMQRDAGLATAELRVDGGAAGNDLLMQLQADLAQAPVLRPSVQETTALGAAYLAGLGTGVFADRSRLAANWQLQQRFEPSGDDAAISRLRRDWARAVERAGGWASTD